MVTDRKELRHTKKYVSTLIIYFSKNQRWVPIELFSSLVFSLMDWLTMCQSIFERCSWKIIFARKIIKAVFRKNSKTYIPLHLISGAVWPDEKNWSNSGLGSDAPTIFVWRRLREHEEIVSIVGTLDVCLGYIKIGTLERAALYLCCCLLTTSIFNCNEWWLWNKTNWSPPSSSARACNSIETLQHKRHYLCCVVVGT